MTCFADPQFTYTHFCNSELAATDAPHSKQDETYTEDGKASHSQIVCSEREYKVEKQVLPQVSLGCLLLSPPALYEAHKTSPAKVQAYQGDGKQRLCERIG